MSDHDKLTTRIEKQGEDGEFYELIFSSTLTCTNDNDSTKEKPKSIVFETIGGSEKSTNLPENWLSSIAPLDYNLNTNSDNSSKSTETISVTEFEIAPPTSSISTSTSTQTEPKGKEKKTQQTQHPINPVPIDFEFPQPGTSTGITCPRYKSTPVRSFFLPPNQSVSCDNSFSSSFENQHQQLQIETQMSSKEMNQFKRPFKRQFSQNVNLTEDEFQPFKRQYHQQSSKEFQDSQTHPGPNDFFWPRNTYPAPNPTAPLPDYLTSERFFQIKQQVEKEASELKVTRQKYFQLIKEKIKLNLIDIPEIDSLDIDDVPKGLPLSKVILINIHDILDTIKCNLCEHIAISPLHCTNCNKWYCLSCTCWFRKVIIKLNFVPPDNKEKAMCLETQCIVKFTSSNDYPLFKKVQQSPSFEKYSSALFICRRHFCNQQIKPVDYFNHERCCRSGLIKDDYDFDMGSKFKHGETIKTFVKPHKNFLSHLAPHLKAAIASTSSTPSNSTHSERWDKKHAEYACVLIERDANPNDPFLSARYIRNHIPGARINYWNCFRRLKDPTEPVSEHEQIMQNMGFEPFLGKKSSSGNYIRPRTIHWSRIPDYLLRENAEWFLLNEQQKREREEKREWQEIKRPYHEDNQPFIRINVFSLIHPEKVESILKSIKLDFPSIRNIDRQKLNSSYRQRRDSSSSTSSNSSRPYGHYHELKLLQTTELFHRCSRVQLPTLPESYQQLIKDNTDKHSNPKLIFSMNMAYCGVIAQYERPQGIIEKIEQKPIWIVIVNGLQEIIYESFVRYKQIEIIQSEYHGLCRSDLRYAKNLDSVRDQVIPYLVVCNQLIGCGLIAQLNALGLTKNEIDRLRYKMREITQYFSPYIKSPCSLSLISFLVFRKFTIEKRAHSPAVEALVSLQLYLAFWPEIEDKCSELKDGIHSKNIERTCGNKRISQLLDIYSSRVNAGTDKWPENWHYYTSTSRNCPSFDSDACASPTPSSPLTPPPGNFVIHVLPEEDEPIHQMHSRRYTHPRNLQISTLNINKMN